MAEISIHFVSKYPGFGPPKRLEFWLWYPVGRGVGVLPKSHLKKSLCVCYYLGTPYPWRRKRWVWQFSPLFAYLITVPSKCVSHVKPQQQQQKSFYAAFNAARFHESCRFISKHLQTNGWLKDHECQAPLFLSLNCRNFQYLKCWNGRLRRRGYKRVCTTEIAIFTANALSGYREKPDLDPNAVLLLLWVGFSYV